MTDDLVQVIVDPRFERLIQGLKDAPQAAQPFAQEAMLKSLFILQDALAPYPPATEANSPGRVSIKTGRPMGYYERGKGYWRPIMREDTLMAHAKGNGTGKFGKSLGRGVVKLGRSARRITQVAGYKLEATSEQLGKNWVTKVSVGEDGVTGELGNNTSYADVVQGSKQAYFHSARGWKTDDTALEETSEPIKEQFAQATLDYIKSLGE